MIHLLAHLDSHLDCDSPYYFGQSPPSKPYSNCYSDTRLTIALHTMCLCCQLHVMIPYMKETDLECIHCHSCKIIGVLLIPRQTKERKFLRVFVNDRRMLKVPQVEHTNRTIGP